MHEVVTCEAVYAESDVYGVVAGIDVGSSAIAPYVNERYSSICLSARTDAFEIIPERFKRDDAGVEGRHDDEDPDVQDHHRHQQLDQAETGLLPQALAHVSADRHAIGCLKTPLFVADSACMAAFSYNAINVDGIEQSGEIHAPTPTRRASSSASRPARREAGRAARQRRGRRPHRLQEDQAEVAPDLLAPVRDDDRGRPERRLRARDPRAANRRRRTSPP